MRPDANSDTPRQDQLQDQLQDMPKFESITVNPGFVPESLAIWRRWRKPARA